MNYLIFILVAILLAISTVYIYNAFTLKENRKENLKVSCLFLLFSIPIVIGIAIITFLALKCLNWILPANISNYKIFVMSFASVFVIFIGESIIKTILSFIMSNYFEKKFKNTNLSQNQIINIINERHASIEILKMVSMFLISVIAYIVISNILSVDNVMITCMVASIVNSILYIFMFRSRAQINNIDKL